MKLFKSLFKENENITLDHTVKNDEDSQLFESVPEPSTITEDVQLAEDAAVVTVKDKRTLSKKIDRRLFKPLPIALALFFLFSLAMFVFFACSHYLPMLTELIRTGAIA